MYGKDVMLKNALISESVFLLYLSNMNYLNLSQLLEHVTEPNRSACLKLWNDNKQRFEEAPGSLVKHQAWKGGYIDHLEESINFGINLFQMMNEYRKLEFTVADIVLVLYLHDLEKPFRYVEPKTAFNSDEEKKEFINTMIQQYGIVLDDIHKNALTYIHGEGDDYSRTERIQKPLAAFVHICDTASARIWFDYPKK